MLSAIRHSIPLYQVPWLTKLGTLISIVKQHIRAYLDPIFSMILEYWDQPQLQAVVIQLVNATAKALEGEFKAFLPRLLPQILLTFDGDLTDPRRQDVLVEILHALAAFGLSLEEFAHLVLPSVLKLLDRKDVSIKVREAAIDSLGSFARRINLSEHASQIIHPLARIIAASSPNVPGSQQLALHAMDSLCALVTQLGTDYAIFIPMMDKVRVGCIFRESVNGWLRPVSLPLDRRSFVQATSTTAATSSSPKRSSTASHSRKTLAGSTRKFKISYLVRGFEADQPPFPPQRVERARQGRHPVDSGAQPAVPQGPLGHELQLFAGRVARLDQVARPRASSRVAISRSESLPGARSGA